MNGYKEVRVSYDDPFPVVILENNYTYPAVMVGSHWHDYYELLYITDGEAEQEINGQVQHAQSGDLVLIYPGAQHSTVTACAGGCMILVMLFYLHGLNFDNLINIRSRYLMPFIHGGLTPHGFISQIGRGHRDIPRIAQEILSEYIQKQPGYQIITKGLLYQLLGYLMRDQRFQVERSQPQKHIEALSEACDYIEQNYFEDISLERVASRVGFSPQYFSRLFKQVVGQNFKAYCDYVRISEAERMLRVEGLSVTATAQLTGYGDVSSFVRAFKRVNRCAPGEVRSKKEQ